MSNVFGPLLENLVQTHQATLGGSNWLIDSFPIALAKQGHRFGAKAAPCYRLWCRGFDNLLNPYSHGLRRKPALNLPVRSALTVASWFISLANSLLLSFSGFSSIPAFDSHFIRHIQVKFTPRIKCQAGQYLGLKNPVISEL